MSNDTTPATVSGSDSSEGLGGRDEKLRRAVKTVLEGWTLPTDARKILEAAVWATPQPPERGPLTDEDIETLFEDGLGFESKRTIAREIERKCAEAWGVKLEGQG